MNSISKYIMSFAFIILISCYPKLVIQKPIKTLVKKPVNQQISDPKNFKEEIARLEVKLLLKDPSMSKKELQMKLFYLLIHYKNPEPDYQKAYLLADSLARNITSNSKNQLYYLNWTTLFKKYFTIQKRKNKASHTIGTLKKKNTALYYENNRQKKHIDSLASVIVDSLLPVIKTQNEAIKKLNEIDLRLEKHRSQIK